MARVSIERLSKVFPIKGGRPIEAVKELCLTVEDKELLVLVGPSGSGKTTILRLIAGLEEATGGEILVDGQPWNKVPPQERDVAMVFQSHALYPQLTVFENMAVGLRLRKRPAQEVDQAVREAAELLELGPCLAMRPEQLSGGQKQRVALGRAIVRRPKLFLLDEPLSSLDGPLRVQMRGEIVRLQRQLGVTMILVTHDQHDAMSVGHRIAVMRAGELQQAARPQELYQAPANRFVAGFIGFPPMQFVRGFLRDRAGTLMFQTKGEGESSISLLIDKAHAAKLQPYHERELVLGIRPEHLSLSAGAGFQGATIPAVVEWAEYLGAETILHLRFGELALQMRLHNASQTGFVPGKTVEIAADMSRACYFDAEKGFALT